MSQSAPKTELNRKELYSGLAFVGIALLFAGHSLLHTIGTPLRMGPSFFPLTISILMGVMGLAIVVQALREGKEHESEEPHHPIPWRGAMLVLGGPILFALTVTGLGLVPATAIVVITGAFASRDMTWPGAILSTVLVTSGCVVIFSWALGLPIRLLGTWIV